MAHLFICLELLSKSRSYWLWWEQISDEEHHTSGVIYKRSVRKLRSPRFNCVFSAKSFTVLVLHYVYDSCEVIFVYDMRKNLNPFFGIWIPSCSATCVEKTILFSLNHLSIVVKNKLTMSVYFCTISSVPSIYMPVHCQHHTVLTSVVL